MDEYKESEASKLIKRLMDEEGFTFSEAVKEAMRQEKEFESKADGGAIGIEVLFKEKMKEGGRVGLFMGGPALEGQALSIYNSMNAYGFTDQEIADRLQSLGYYTPGGLTPDTPSDNIIGAQLHQGGGGGGGITELQKTFTTETAPPSKPYKVTNFPETSVRKDFFETKQLPSYTYNQMGGLSITPDVRKDMVEYFADETSVGNYPIPEQDTSFIGSIKDKFGSLKDKFFKPKVRGTLGNRLQKQFELGQKLPSPLAKIAGTQSPFNPDSKNYNPDFIDQLNFLELGDDMIGMSSTGLKYGEGSVLRGQNVFSGFGSNNYLKQLNKYINRRNITDKARQRGIAERRAFLEAEERKRDAAFQAQLNEQQRQQRQADLDRISRAYREETGGQGGSYATGQSGIQRDSAGREVGYVDPFDPGGGEKDGGFIDGYNRRKYSDGGLATMFKPRRR